MSSKRFEVSPKRFQVSQKRFQVMSKRFQVHTAMRHRRNVIPLPQNANLWSGNDI